MSEIMELIETYAHGAPTSQIFAGEGKNLSASALIRMSNPKYAKAHARFEEAYGNMIAGHRASYKFVHGLLEGDLAAYKALSEALGPSDFPYLFGDTIDRVLLAKYKAYVPVWREYLKVSAVQNFLDAKRFRCSPGRGILPALGPGESYKADKPSESYYALSVEKRGGVRNLFWEALVNDDLQALQDTPNDFAWQAQQTEAYVATSLFAANTTLYGDHVVNGVTYTNLGHAELSAATLAAAIGAMGDFPGDDEDSLPIANDPIYIVVGTVEMQLKAEQILNSLVVQYTGSADKMLPTANLISAELRSRMKVRLNKMLRMFDTNYQTSWYLFSDPGDGFAAEMAFLRGYEAPQLFMRASSQVALSGGLVSAMEGGFDNDAIDYKVRVIFGGAHTNGVGGWRFSYWSDGTMSS